MAEGLAGLPERVAAAPFDPGSWPEVLGELGAAVGGWGGQLVGMSSDQFRFYLADKDVSDDLIREYAAFGGGDPAINPRAAAGWRAPPLKMISDPDFISTEERGRREIYRFLDRIDAGYAGLGVLAADEDFLICTVVCFDQRKGPPGPDERARFEALLPHLRAAALLQTRMEEEAARIALGAFDAVASPAILCDYAGRVVGASAAAETILNEGRLLAVRQGRLHAGSPRSDAALQTAIARAGALESLLTPASSEAPIEDRARRTYLRAIVAPMPRAANSFRRGARVLVTLPAPRPAGEARELLRRLGLSAAEAEVACALAHGASARQIADRRGVALDTVRTQMRSIYAKLDVNRQAELAALLRDLV